MRMRSPRKSNAEPLQSSWKTTRGEIDLKDSAMGRLDSRLRSMQNWCRVQPDIASIRQAGFGATPFNNLRDFGFRDAAKPMRSRCDQQRSVSRRYCIKVDT